MKEIKLSSNKHSKENEYRCSSIKTLDLTKNKNISEIYNYFLNNISNYSFKNKHMHLRMKSENGLSIKKT